ncbi:MAG TPA: sulfur carrier protein ThiS [Actinomycetota bacterium]|nr:sulfur carrier protein ThiS [Actinomycetota bacterium]
MVVSANGKPIEVPQDCTVQRLIEMLGLGSRWVVVERNGLPVARSDFDTVRLEPGDVLEVVRPVQGG